MLANLGSFYLCDGAFEKARDAYKRARDLAPQSYVRKVGLHERQVRCGLSGRIHNSLRCRAVTTRRHSAAVALSAPPIVTT